MDIPSPSRSEAALAEHVSGTMPDNPPISLAYAHDTCLWYRTARTEGTPVAVLAGHLDTVPSQGNLPGRIGRTRVHGLGASDMKGGLAVMIELARWIASEHPRLSTSLDFVFFGREELAVAESPLPQLLDDDRFAADLVVVLEPTDNELQAGCLGNINARLIFEGESAHSARPWTGTNAIGLAVHGLLPLVDVEPAPVEIDGLTFYEVVSVTGISGGIASNVIPGEAEAMLNFRYAPTRSPGEAEARLRELAGPSGRLLIESNSPSGRVDLRAPIVQRLLDAGDLKVAPKQAWTPVAQFTERGFNAVNLGPGATRYAHKRDEQVEIAELVRAYEVLQRFATGTVGR